MVCNGVSPLEPESQVRRCSATLGAAGAAAFTSLALGLFAWHAVDGLWRPDAFDYAQIARELVSGNGFSSRQVIYVLHLDFLREHGLLASDWPNLHRFPLPSLAMAAGFLLFGASDAAVVGYGIVFHAATSALLFTWARAAIGPAAGAAAVFLFTVNGVMLETGTSGLSEPPVMFFFTLSIYLLWRLRESTRAAAFAAVGVSLGLATLARTNAIFVAPLYVLALVAQDGRGNRSRLVMRTAWLAGGVLLVITPWLLRNQLVAGSPFFSLHSYFLLPSGTEPNGLKFDLSLPWVREFTPPLEFALAYPDRVLTKWWSHGLRLLREFPTLGGSFGVPVIAALGMALPAGKGLRSVARLLFACFALNAALVCFTDFYFDKYHFHFVPGMILLAVGVSWQALLRIPRAGLRGMAFAAVVLVLADLPGAYASAGRVERRTAQIEREAMKFVLARTGADAIILSDQSYAIAWHTGQRSVRIHFDRLKDGRRVLAAGKISRNYVPIDAVFLSADFLRRRGGRQVLTTTLAERPGFRQRFPLMRKFPSGAILFFR